MERMGDVIDKLTNENAELKERVAELEAVLRAASPGPKAIPVYWWGEVCRFLPR